MLEDEMHIKDVKIPDIEKIVELKPLAHVNAGNNNTNKPVPLPKPPLFNVVQDDNDNAVYDDKWHHGNVKYTTINKPGVKSGARKKDMQKPVNLR